MSAPGAKGAAAPAVTELGGDGYIRKAGKAFITACYGALRAIKLYPIENAAVQQALNELHEIMTGLLRTEGSVELRVVGDFFTASFSSG